MTSPFLDLDRLRGHPFIGRVDWHSTIASTNDRALALAAGDTLDTPLLVLADEQTAGRGRGSNSWWSARGALTFSLVLAPQVGGIFPGQITLGPPSPALPPRGGKGAKTDFCRELVSCVNTNTPQFNQRSVGPLELPQDCWPRIALVAGLSLCEALERLLPHLAFGLKWPNDVLLGGKKLAGILVEVPSTTPQKPRRIVLGMGININNSLADAPAEIQSSGTALCDAAGLEFDATQVLLAWLTHFADNLRALAEKDTGLTKRWQMRCVLSGKRVELQSGDRMLNGTCRGIDTDGALLLDTPARLERLYSGVLVRVVG
ncbi:MAG: biotin--[acetyl-CoA-carboxylase] ligase [Planctomycetaceae bacterium]